MYAIMDHQEEFLNNFFTQVSQLCFDKAKESVEKEKDFCKSTQMGPWGMLLTYLPQIIMVERSYADLGFLQTKNKSFLRKDHSLKTIYESLKSDFKKLEEVTGGSSTSETIVTEVSHKLCNFITARIHLIDFYEKMYNMSITNKVMRHEELLQVIESIVKDQPARCSHPVLTAMKASLKLECDILVYLMRAQIHVQKWQFLPSLAAIHDAQTKLTTWEKTLQNKEVDILLNLLRGSGTLGLMSICWFKSWILGGFSANFLKANQPPALYQWLSKLRAAILAKFALYFYVILCQQTNSSSEMKNHVSKQSVDYYHKMQSFQRKSDAIAIAIVFDLRTSQDSGPSYRHPDRELDTSENYSFIISYPSIFMQKPSFHWNEIKKCIEERRNDPLNIDKVAFIKTTVKHSMDLVTYALLNIDSYSTLITVYESNKQKDRESQVTTFMTDLCMQIRCNKIYESLKLAK